MILLKFEFFLALNIMGEEQGDMSCFKIPKYTNISVSLSIIGLSSTLTWKGFMKDGDFSTTVNPLQFLGMFLFNL